MPYNTSLRWGTLAVGQFWTGHRMNRNSGPLEYLSLWGCGITYLLTVKWTLAICGDWHPPEEFQQPWGFFQDQSGCVHAGEKLAQRHREWNLQRITRLLQVTLTGITPDKHDLTGSRRLQTRAPVLHDEREPGLCNTVELYSREKCGGKFSPASNHGL